MNGWQILYICVTLFNLLTEALLDGKPRVGNHNFAASLMCTAISYFVLYMGGFFR